MPEGVARPYGIVVDSNARPWVAFMGTNAIGTVDRPYGLELRLERAAGSGDDHSVSYHLRKSSAAASL